MTGELEPFSGPLLPALTRAVRLATGVELDERALRPDAIAGYLRFTFRVLGEQGEVVAQSRDLAQLLEAHGARASAVARRASSPVQWERTRLSSWDFDELPEFITRLVQGTRLRSYPALVDRQSHVDLSLLESAAAADSATRSGVRRLLALGARSSLDALGKRIPPPFPRAGRMPPSRAEQDAFRELIVSRVVRDAFGISEESALPRTRTAFDAVLRAGLPRIEAVFSGLGRAIGAAAAELDKLERALDGVATQPSGTLAGKDIRAQLEKLCPADLMRSLEVERLEQFPRYLRAAQARLTRAIHDPRKDADKLAPLVPVWNAFLAKQPSARDQKAASALRWAFEELRVAIFAPELKPALSVSLASLSLSVSSLR
jgi:ATP-dependent helicase HrpA